MSLKLEGQTCPVCHAYLFDEDDIVYCPVCGAPHHRDCYNSIGHCGLEELHGTEQQYDSAKFEEKTEPAVEIEKKNPVENFNTVKCQMCGEKYDDNEKACPKCGAPNVKKLGGGFAGFDFLGGVPEDFDIGEGVTADEAKRFVTANTPRYIPKFATLNKKNKASWNWLAFLIPSGWFFSRKMYKNGILSGILMVAASLFSFPLNKALYATGATDVTNYTDMMKNIYASLPDIGNALIIMAVAGVIFSLAIRIFIAMFGDYYYKCHVVNTIKSIKSESTDIDTDYRKKGGINFFGMILGIMLVEYLPSIIAMFI